jgi:hypothetical protein
MAMNVMCGKQIKTEVEVIGGLKHFLNKLSGSYQIFEGFLLCKIAYVKKRDNE